MKKILTLLILVATLVNLLPLDTKAQCPGCVVNNGCTSNPAKPTICPDTLPDGVAMQNYSEDISFYLPAQFVDDGTGFNVTLNQMTVLNVTGLPFGLSWETNAVNNIYYPSSNPPATEYGCARICGTPLMAGSYTVTVFVQAEVTVAGIGQTVDDNFTLPLTILPSQSSNGSFSINNPMGCAPLTSGFVNNMPSGGNPGFSYQWDFGNGNQSSSENPPIQSYPNPGTYVVSMQTTIDTIGFFLTSVSVLGSSGCDDSPFSAPDYYFNLLLGGTTVYSSSYIDNSNAPVTFSFSQIPLSNSTYSIEIYDYDTGLAGDDDYCGTVTFNGNTEGTQTLTSGSLVVSVTITHPVIVLDATDTINVYPTPQVSSISVFPNDSVCTTDSIRLSVIASAPVTYQWYRDTLAVLNAIDSFYFAKQSGTYYCEVMNTYGCRANSNNRNITMVPNPPKPTFWITGNQLNTNLTGYALQWYFEGASIAGATGMTYALTATGNYFLTATNYFGCESFSDTVFVTYNNSGLSDDLLIGRLELFPNPTSTSFTLRVRLNANTPVAFSLYDLQGRKLMDTDLGDREGEVIEKIEMQHLNSGVYIFEIQLGSSTLHRRVTKL